MTVKIISKPKHLPRRAECSYEEDDIRKRSGRDYGGGSDGRRWIVCASCGKDIILEVW